MLQEHIQLIDLQIPLTCWDDRQSFTDMDASSNEANDFPGIFGNPEPRAEPTVDLLKGCSVLPDGIIFGCSLSLQPRDYRGIDRVSKTYTVNAAQRIAFTGTRTLLFVPTIATSRDLMVQGARSRARRPSGAVLPFQEAPQGHGCGVQTALVRKLW